MARQPMAEPVATTKSFAALVTPVGRGAVAVIRITGDLRLLDGCWQPRNPRRWNESAVGMIAFGRWCSPTIELTHGSDHMRSQVTAAEEIVAWKLAPEIAELSCHGGVAAASRVLSDLAALGFKIVDSAAMAAPRASRLSCDIAIALRRVRTQRSADLLWEQASGVLEEHWQAWQRMAAGGERDELQSALNAALNWSGFGQHLSRPWTVVLVGRPNVGKSSLLNRLLGFERAIVSPIAGTTRDVVGTESAIDGWSVQFKDTAGQRETSDPLEALGVERAQAEHTSAELVLLVLNGNEPLTDEDHSLLVALPHALIVVNQIDRPAAWEPEENLAGREFIRVSALTAHGIDQLLEQISRQLVPEVPSPGTPYPVTAAQAAMLSQVHAELSTLAGNGSSPESAAAVLRGVAAQLAEWLR